MFEGVGGGWRGGGVPTALGRIDVGACYTRGARSRPIYIPGNMYLVCA